MIRLLRKLWTTGKQFLEKIGNDSLTAFAAQAAFFIIVSFFPFAMLLMTMLQFLPVGEADLIQSVRTILPETFANYAIPLIKEVFALQGPKTIISLTLISALWASSKGFVALVRGFNNVYGIKEKRNYIVLRALCAVYALAFAIILGLMLVLMVFGNRLISFLLSRLPGLSDYVFPFLLARVLLTFTVLFFFFLLLYMVLPSRRVTFGQAYLGALFATIGWSIFTFLYAFYVDHFRVSSLYGSLTTVVLMMLWLYTCMYILLLGAEVNVWMEKNT